MQDTGVDTSGGEAIWKTVYMRHFGGPKRGGTSWFAPPPSLPSLFFSSMSCAGLLLTCHSSHCSSSRFRLTSRFLFPLSSFPYLVLLPPHRRQFTQSCAKQWAEGSVEKRFKWSVASGHWRALDELVSQQGWRGIQLDSFPGDKRTCEHCVPLCAMLIDILNSGGSHSAASRGARRSHGGCGYTRRSRGQYHSHQYKEGDTRSGCVCEGVTVSHSVVFN